MKIWILMLSLVGILCAAFLPDWRFYSMTGRFRPVYIVESLKSPVQIREVTKSGLVTADGKVLNVPEVSEIPQNAAVIRDIINHGVEIDSMGAIHALIQIHHWCGNDPVRHHLARVDLSSAFLVIQNEAKPREAMIDPGSMLMLQIPPAELKKIFTKARTEPGGQPTGRRSEFE